MPMAKITPVGEAGLYHVHFLDATDPGYGRPGGGGHPDHGLPGDRPPHVGGGPIFHPGHPDHGLPSNPAHPGNRPPGSGHPVFPDNTLPSTPPPHVPAGVTLVLVRDPTGVWHYATLDANTPPPKPVPPGSIDHPSGQPIPPPGSTPPPTAGTPLPPTAAPKR